MLELQKATKPEIDNDPWHVYSNPKKPTIFPVISMAKYLLSHPDILTTNSNIFPGNYQYETFLKIFHKIINENLEELHSLGFEKGTLVDQSVRKGDIKIVASNCTVSPRMASICLRACWNMVPIKYQYIHYDNVVHNFVGCSVTGIYSLPT